MEPLALQVQRFITPYSERIEDLQRTVGRLEAIAERVPVLEAELHDTRAQLVGQAETIGGLRARQIEPLPGWAFVTGVTIAFILGAVVTVMIVFLQ